jgi:hypothetical protein
LVTLRSSLPSYPHAGYPRNSGSHPRLRAISGDGWRGFGLDEAAEVDTGAAEQVFHPGRRLLLFELGPYPGEGGDVIVIEGIDEVFLH